MRTHPKAFTLLELAAVMAIIAVLSSSVLVKSAGWFRSARVNHVVGQLIFFDQLARRSAVGHEREMELVFNLDTGSVIRTDRSKGEESHSIRLPKGFRITKVITPRSQAVSGIVKIPVTPMGHTPTYAVGISGPSDQKRWYGITGLTGQLICVNESGDIDELFSLFKNPSSKRPT